MTSIGCQDAPVDKLLASRFDRPAPKPISSNRLLGSLREAAGWPGTDRNTVVTLARSLVAARADAEGSSYFQDLSERNPADATAQALAGFFQVRAGHEPATAMTKLGAGLAATETARADQVIADLEFVLAARDQFPVLLLRAAHHGVARADRLLSGGLRWHDE
jgi:hypothetical protein